MCQICTTTELLYNVKFQRNEFLLNAVKIGDVPIVHGCTPNMDCRSAFSY